jgi:hypothetical protein
VANGEKMLAKDIWKKMHIKKNHFAELLIVCNFAETKPFHLDRRQTVITSMNQDLESRTI